MHGRIGATILLLALVTPSLASTKKKPTEHENEAYEQADIIRLIGAAETDFFLTSGRYATLPELVQSGKIERGAELSTRYSRALQLLHLHDSQLVEGFSFGLVVAPDGKGYKMSLTKRGQACPSAWFTDESGTVYEGKALDCASVDSGAEFRDWNVNDVDPIPPPRNDTPCPLFQIVQNASLRASELVDNLQRFSARERIEHIQLGKDGKRRSSTNHTVNYVAEIRPYELGGFFVQEYRSGGMENEQALFTDTGTAAFALMFHPHFLPNFDFRCDGKTDLQGTPAWQLRFEESPDPYKSFHAIRIGGSVYQLRFKGRAWIAAADYQVLRLQTDLVAPIAEIELQAEHLDISYAPVAFPKRNLRLWLPESASLFMAYRGHRYARLHTFNQFQLFFVDTEQKVKEPQAGLNGQPQ
jgi:hypothetical protein